MSTFSRGFTSFLHQQFRLPSSFRTVVFSSRSQSFQPLAFRSTRFFSSSLPRRYQYGHRTNTSTVRTFISSDPVLRTVVQTREPVLLYQAPKNRYYLLTVYGVAGLWIGTGLYAIYFQDHLKYQGLSGFIRPTYIVVGIAFVIIGFYIANAPARRMQSLEVIPGIMGGPVQLRMRVRNLPWVKERIIVSHIGDATISEKTNPMVAELVEAERARRQGLYDEELAQMFVIPRVWELSARWVQQKWTSFFLRFKFAVLRFGIAEVRVHGDKWKIDCSGWLREDGKAIDRIISEH